MSNKEPVKKGNKGEKQKSPDDANDSATTYCPSLCEILDKEDGEALLRLTKEVRFQS
jgi:hypothetical protein